MEYIPQGPISGPALDLEHKDFTPGQRPAGDHYAHAAGRICEKCDREIQAIQPARRKGESGWVHDVCPD